MTSKNLKNPAVNIAPAPRVGIDAAIELIRQQLATLPWLQKAFGRAWSKPRTQDGKAVAEPMLYQGGKEYYPALPNDALKSYCFFKVNGPRRTIDYTANMNTGGRYIMQDSVDLIFWVDLKAINAAMDWIFTETLIQDVMKKLGGYLGGPMATVDQIYDDRVEDIFAGYDTRELKQGLLLYPYKGFRLSCTITYEFGCVVEVTPEPEPEEIGLDEELDAEL
jgi:hypothetical protein